MNCSDADPGHNGDVSLSLDSGNSGDWFKMDGMSLYTDGVLVDYDVSSSSHMIVLTISARDSPDNGPAKLAVVIVVVQVVTSYTLFDVFFE